MAPSSVFMMQVYVCRNQCMPRNQCMRKRLKTKLEVGCVLQETEKAKQEVIADKENKHNSHEEYRTITPKRSHTARMLVGDQYKRLQMNEQYPSARRVSPSF